MSHHQNDKIPPQSGALGAPSEMIFLFDESSLSNRDGCAKKGVAQLSTSLFSAV